MPSMLFSQAGLAGLQVCLRPIASLLAAGVTRKIRTARSEQGRQPNAERVIIQLRRLQTWRTVLAKGHGDDPPLSSHNTLLFSPHK